MSIQGRSHPEDEVTTRAERLLGNLHGVVWEADTDTGQFVYVSPQAERLLGYPLSHWLAPGFWADHLHPEDRAKAVAYCLEATQAQRDHYLEYRMLTADGGELWVGDSVTVIAEGARTRRLCGVMVPIASPHALDAAVAHQPLGATMAQTAAPDEAGHATPRLGRTPPGARRAGAARHERLHFLESMERINQALQGEPDVERVMLAALEALLEVLDCERAFLIECAEGTPPRWALRYERTVPAWPGAGHGALMIAPDSPLLVPADKGPVAVRMDPASGVPLPALLSERYAVRSALHVLLRLRPNAQWVLGVHQCSFARVWTAAEVHLFEHIGRRLGDALTGLLAHRALSIGERRLQEAQRLARIGYWERDLDAGLLTLSEQSFEIYDLPCQTTPLDLEVFLQQWRSRLHADDRDRVLAELDAAWTAGTTYDIEYRYVDGRGEPRHLRSLGARDGGTAGGSARWFGTVQDNSNLRRMERELSSSETRLRDYLDNATDAISVHDRGGALIDANQQLCDSLGYTRAELIGQMPTLFDRHVPLWRLSAIRAGLDRGEPVSFRSRHRRKDGSEFPVELRMKSYMRDGVTRAVAVTRDISEQVAAEQALEHSNTLLRAVVEGTSEAIYVKDTAGRFLLINSAGARRLGRSMADIVGRSAAELAAAGTPPLHDVASAPPVDGRFHEETVTLDGEARTFLTARHPYRGTNGEELGVIGVSHDVTELRRLEAQFHQAQKMEAIGRLAGGLAHDFNNLLTVILGYGGVLREQLAAQPSQSRLVDEIVRCGERAATLVGQLLAFSRKQTLRPVRVDIGGLLHEWESLIRPLLDEDVELEVVLGAGVAPVTVDPVLLEQALTNLAINARDAMPNGGALRIELRQTDVSPHHPRGELPTGRYAEIRVADQGLGMDAETLAQVFDPFFTTKAVGKGTGLGLAMVYGFAKQSAGDIEVHSQPGQGSTFCLLLPTSSEHEGEREVPPAAQPPTPRAHGGGATVLLVEDEQAVRKLARELLETDGYRVLEAADGVAALELARHHAGDIDLLLSDVIMPRMKGPELAKRLRRTRPGLPVLFMSGHSERHDAALGNLLVKPFAPQALAARVRALLRGKARRTERP